VPSELDEAAWEIDGAAPTRNEEDQETVPSNKCYIFSSSRRPSIAPAYILSLPVIFLLPSTRHSRDENYTLSPTEHLAT